MQKDRPQIVVGFDWAIIAAMKQEQKELARRMSSEAVKAARARLEAHLKRSR